MQQLRQQLEDLSFAALFPKRFAALDHLVSTRTPEQDVYIAKVVAETRAADVETCSIDGEVAGRGKHLWSIYEKMIHSNREFDEIFDIVAIRILVDSVKDCYAALGCIHGNWMPVQGRFKDYIAMPKFNLYQSLHTTVMGPGGQAGRGADPHPRDASPRRVGRGVALGLQRRASQREIAWVNRIVDWQSEVSDPESVHGDAEVRPRCRRRFSSSPRREWSIRCRSEPTPIDFAYAVHTAVGHSCIGARVNGQLVALNSTLNSGDTCEIIRSKVDSAGPSRDWLQFAASPTGTQQDPPMVLARTSRGLPRYRARRVARRTSPRGASGAEDHELRRRSVTEAEVAGYGDAVPFLVAIGEHHVSARAIAQRIARSLTQRRLGGAARGASCSTGGRNAGAVATSGYVSMASTMS